MEGFLPDLQGLYDQIIDWNDEVTSWKFVYFAVVSQLLIVSLVWSLRFSRARWRSTAAWLSKSKIRYFRGIHLDGLIDSITNPPEAQNSRLLTFAVLILAVAGLGASLVITQKMSHDGAEVALVRDQADIVIAIQDGKELTARQDQLAKELVEDDAAKIKRFYPRVARNALLFDVAFWCWLGMSVFAAAVALWTCFYWSLRRSVSTNLATLHKRYMARMMAIATKDEARQLAVLELHVEDEMTLRAFLSRLYALSQRYSFPIDSLFLPYALPAVEPVPTIQESVAEHD